MGNKVGASLLALHEAGADVVGFNCSVGSDQMVRMVEDARDDGVDAPIVAQPNAGQPRTLEDGQTVYDARPDEFVRDLVQMVDIGARVVGGCCGTNPDFLRAARAALDARDAPGPG